MRSGDYFGDNCIIKVKSQFRYIVKESTHCLFIDIDDINEITNFYPADIVLMRDKAWLKLEEELKHKLTFPISDNEGKEQEELRHEKLVPPNEVEYGKMDSPFSCMNVAVSKVLNPILRAKYRLGEGPAIDPNVIQAFNIQANRLQEAENKLLKEKCLLGPTLQKKALLNLAHEPPEVEAMPEPLLPLTNAFINFTAYNPLFEQADPEHTPNIDEKMQEVVLEDEFFENPDCSFHMDNALASLDSECLDDFATLNLHCRTTDVN